jgi:hypothetical protein
MQRVKDFFSEIDQQWPHGAPNKVRLHVIGSGALMLQTNYQRGTNDSDILAMTDLAAETQQHLRQLAGVNSELAARRRMYIDIVANGIPFLPHPPTWHAIDELNRTLTRLEIFALDVVDVVVAS